MLLIEAFLHRSTLYFLLKLKKLSELITYRKILVESYYSLIMNKIHKYYFILDKEHNLLVQDNLSKNKGVLLLPKSSDLLDSILNQF